MVNTSKHTVSLSNQKCTAESTLNNLQLMNSLKDYVNIHLRLI